MSNNSDLTFLGNRVFVYSYPALSTEVYTVITACCRVISLRRLL